MLLMVADPDGLAAPNQNAMIAPMMQQPATIPEIESFDRTIISFPRAASAARLVPLEMDVHAETGRENSGSLRGVVWPLAVIVPSLMMLALLMGAFLILLALVGLLALGVVICELIGRQQRAKLASRDS
jgi:hypothetical protein